ncbi:hypothetical protein ACFYXM_03915 [Streptomyces sp. NPDC002476]
MDLVIRDAYVIDGTGSPGRRADVAAARAGPYGGEGRGEGWALA